MIFRLTDCQDKIGVIESQIEIFLSHGKSKRADSKSKRL